MSSAGIFGTAPADAVAVAARSIEVTSTFAPERERIRSPTRWATARARTWVGDAGRGVPTTVAIRSARVRLGGAVGVRAAASIAKAYFVDRKRGVRAGEGHRSCEVVCTAA